MPLNVVSLARISKALNSAIRRRHAVYPKKMISAISFVSLSVAWRKGIKAAIRVRLEDSFYNTIISCL